MLFRSIIWFCRTPKGWCDKTDRSVYRQKFWISHKIVSCHFILITIFFPAKYTYYSKFFISGKWGLNTIARMKAISCGQWSAKFIFFKLPIKFGSQNTLKNLFVLFDKSNLFADFLCCSIFSLIKFYFLLLKPVISLCVDRYDQ